MSRQKVKLTIYITSEEKARIKSRAAALHKRSMGEYIVEVVNQEMGIFNEEKDGVSKDSPII